MPKDRLRVTAVIPASPEHIYRAWLDGSEHAAFTGSRATVDPNGRFTAWDGYIQGTTVNRHPGRRIVQTWRTAEFPKGSTDSRLEIQLERVADGTRVTVIHTDIPEGQGEQYKSGWTKHYFEPMRAYFAKFAAAEIAARKAAVPKAPPSTKSPPKAAAAAPERAKKAGTKAVPTKVSTAPEPPKAQLAPKKTPKPTAKPAAKVAKGAARPAKKAVTKPTARPGKKPGKKS